MIWLFFCSILHTENQTSIFSVEYSFTEVNWKSLNVSFSRGYSLCLHLKNPIWKNKSRKSTPHPVYSTQTQLSCLTQLQLCYYFQSSYIIKFNNMEILILLTQDFSYLYLTSYHDNRKYSPEAAHMFQNVQCSTKKSNIWAKRTFWLNLFCLKNQLMLSFEFKTTRNSTRFLQQDIQPNVLGFLVKRDCSCNFISKPPMQLS